MNSRQLIVFLTAADEVWALLLDQRTGQLIDRRKHAVGSEEFEQLLNDWIAPGSRVLIGLDCDRVLLADANDVPGIPDPAQATPFDLEEICPVDAENMVIRRWNDRPDGLFAVCLVDRTRPLLERIERRRARIVAVIPTAWMLQSLLDTESQSETVAPTPVGVWYGDFGESIDPTSAGVQAWKRIAAPDLDAPGLDEGLIRLDYPSDENTWNRLELAISAGFERLRGVPRLDFRDGLLDPAQRPGHRHPGQILAAAVLLFVISLAISLAVLASRYTHHAKQNLQQRNQIASSVLSQRPRGAFISRQLESQLKTLEKQQELLRQANQNQNILYALDELAQTFSADSRFYLSYIGCRGQLCEVRGHAENTQRLRQFKKQLEQRNWKVESQIFARDFQLLLRHPGVGQ